MSSQTGATTVAKAAVLRAIGGPLQMESINIRAPKAGEVLVRMVGVGVCHTDIVCRDGFPVPMPIVLGHEGSGVVESVGAGVTRVKPGDHVVLSFNSCGECGSCKDEHPATCAQFLPFNFAGVNVRDGSTPLEQNGQVIHGEFFGQSSFATYAIAHEVNTVPVPKSAPLDILGPLGCGVQTGAGAAINSLKMGPGDTLVIFGGGAVGLSALLGAVAVGAKQIIVVEPNESRRKLALELGASHAIDPKATEDVPAAVKEASGGGVRYGVDTTGIAAVIGNAVNCIIPGGTLGLIGVPAPDVQFPFSVLDLIIKCVNLKPIMEGDANPQTFIPHMVDLYEKGKFPFDRLVVKFPFDQINEAMHAGEKGLAIKPVLVF